MRLVLHITIIDHDERNWRRTEGAIIRKEFSSINMAKYECRNRNIVAV